MRTYTIGEAIQNFKLNSVGYVMSGKTKGTLLFVNYNNENRIGGFYPDGNIYLGLHIAVNPDMPIAEQKEIVFLNEVEEDVINGDGEAIDVLKDIQQRMVEYNRVFLDELSKIPEDEQLELIEEIIRVKKEALTPKATATIELTKED